MRVWLTVLAAMTVSLGLWMDAQGPTNPDLKQRVDGYWAAWGSGSLDRAGAFYAKDPELVFFDLEPVKFVGWDAYRAGVVPAVLSKFSKVSFTVFPDLVSGREGRLAWTAVTVRADGVLKAAGPITVTVRHTAVWEQRGSDWLIVHEHVSVPSALPPPPGPAR